MRFPILKTLAWSFSVQGIIFLLFSVLAGVQVYQLAAANASLRETATVAAFGVGLVGVSIAFAFFAMGSAIEVLLAIEESTRVTAETSSLVLQSLDRLTPVADLDTVPAARSAWMQDAFPAPVEPGKLLQIKCAKCGGVNDAAGSFCRVCGTRIKDTCSKCGGSVVSSDKFCRACGALQPGRDAAADTDDETVGVKRSPL